MLDNLEQSLTCCMWRGLRQAFRDLLRRSLSPSHPFAEQKAPLVNRLAPLVVAPTP